MEDALVLGCVWLSWVVFGRDFKHTLFQLSNRTLLFPYKPGFTVTFFHSPKSTEKVGATLTLPLPHSLTRFISGIGLFSPDISHASPSLVVSFFLCSGKGIDSQTFLSFPQPYNCIDSAWGKFSNRQEWPPNYGDIVLLPTVVSSAFHLLLS